MSQPNTQRPRKRRYHGNVPVTEVNKFLNAFRALDRTVVEISMHIYKVPQHHRAAMLKQHRRLHDTVRKRLPRLLYTTAQPQVQFQK